MKKEFIYMIEVDNNDHWIYKIPIDLSTFQFEDLTYYSNFKSGYFGKHDMNQICNVISNDKSCRIITEDELFIELL